MTTAPPPLSLRRDDWRFRLLVAPEYADRVTAEGLDCAAGYDAIMTSAKRIPGGRGSNRILDGCGDPIRLRPILHGGVFAYWFGARFLGPDRPFREFRISRALHERGVRIPVPVLAVSRRRGLFWRSSFASVEHAGALDGAAWLAAHQAETQRRRACMAFANAVRELHDSGGIHGDLHLRNVLIEPSPAQHNDLRCLPIDLDRARIVSSVSPRVRMRELMRFARSLQKSGQTSALSKRLQALTLSTYCRGDRQLRAAMMRYAPLELRRLRRHQLAWKLGRHLSMTILVGLIGFLLGCDDPNALPTNTGEDTHVEAARWSLIATGDTGSTRAFANLLEGQLSVARAMTEEAKRSPVDAVVLLGDNFYWYGLDRENLAQRIRTNLVRPYCYFLNLSGERSHEVEGACGVSSGSRSAVPIFAVLGNHDLELPESVHLHRKAIPKFLPDWRMSETLAQVFEVASGVSLILFESELAIDDRGAIEHALKAALSQARGPWHILATHRPVATDDEGRPPHGGYPAYVRDAIAASGKSVQLVLAGHHHNLQVFEIGAPTPLLHIGVGSGSRAEPPLAQDHPESRFGAIDLGFARVDLVGQGAEERLSVRLFDAAPWPWLTPFRKSTLRAHYEVDRRGRVSRGL